MKKLLAILVLGLLLSSNAYAEKPKKEKEKVSIEDLEELGVYAEFKTDQYPEQMYLILKRGCSRGITCQSKNAVRYLAKAFSRGQNYQQRHPDNIIKIYPPYRPVVVQFSSLGE